MAKAKLSENELNDIRKLGTELGSQHLVDAIAVAMGKKLDSVPSQQFLKNLTHRQATRIISLLSKVKSGKRPWLRWKNIPGRCPTGMVNQVDHSGNFVYFITDGEFVKIGTAYDVSARLKDLQTGNPKRLKILVVTTGGFKTEKKYHRMFDLYKTVGEWYEIGEEILKEIKALGGYTPKLPNAKALEIYSGKKGQKKKRENSKYGKGHTIGRKITVSQEQRVIVEFSEPITTFPFKETRSIEVFLLESPSGLMYRTPSPGDKYKHMADGLRDKIISITPVELSVVQI